LSFKKGIAAVVLICVGVYASHAVDSNPQVRETIGRFAGENNLTAAGLKLELGSDANLDLDNTSQSKNEQAGQTDTSSSEASLPPFPSDVTIPETAQPEPEESPVILPTTIEGGVVITNNTSYELDLNNLVSAGTSVKLASEGPQILIIHMHGSEAYMSDIAVGPRRLTITGQRIPNTVLSG